MDALEISRKFEAKKIAPQTVHVTRQQESDSRAQFIERRTARLVTLMGLFFGANDPGCKPRLLHSSTHFRQASSA
jgi:hypothetical protein